MKRDNIFWRVLIWIKDLFKGYVIGIEDLFLASWKRIVALLLLLIVPTVYGLSMSLAYWNPTANLNRVPIVILDQDDEYIKVEQVDKTDGNKYVYHIGAIESIGGSNIIPGTSHDELLKDVSNLTAGTLIHLNTGKDISYNPTNTVVEITSAWDQMKPLLTKDIDKKDDTDAKFALKVAPSPKLQFNNIKYVKDSKKIDDIWKTSKYQGQMKISKGYGANVLKQVGLVFENNKETTKTKTEVMPKIDVFTTFQRSFLVGYLLNTFIQFKDYLIQGVTPIVSAMDDGRDSMMRFGVDGDTLNRLISVQEKDKEALVAPVYESGKYYLIIDSDKFKDKTGLAIPEEYTLKGKLNLYVDEIKAFKGSYGKQLNVMFPDTFRFIDFANAVFGDLDNSDIVESLEQILFGTTTNDNKLLANYKTVMEVTTNDKFVDPIPNGIKSLMKDDGTLSEDDAVNNLNTFAAKILASNKMFNNVPYVSMLGEVYYNIQLMKTTNGFNIKDTYDVDVQGEEKAIYGIGMGALFFIIGLFIGTTMLRGVITRDKQYNRLTSSSWFLSKWLIYATLGFIQVTIQVWMIYAIAWHTQLSPSSMGFIYLWVLNADFVIISVVIGLQYAFSSPLVGAIVAVLYLMLNIGSGGGSYPAMLQFQFYWDIHWILPFTYIIEGLDEINFGINIVGQTQNSTDFLVTHWAILLAFIAFFMSIGLIASKFRIHQVTYGSWKGKYIFQGLMELKRFEMAKDFKLIEKTKKGMFVKYNWKALKPRFDSELYEAVRNIQREQHGFKWYVEKRKKQKIADDLVER